MVLQAPAVPAGHTELTQFCCWEPAAAGVQMGTTALGAHMADAGGEVAAPLDVPGLVGGNSCCLVITGELGWR